MRRVAIGLAIALGLVIVAPASAQSLGGAQMTGTALHVDAQRLFPPEPRAAVRVREAERPSEPAPPLQPLLDHLPLQLIPELLRAPDRLSFSIDGYTVKPRVGFHEVALVVTRPLSN